MKNSNLAAPANAEYQFSKIAQALDEIDDDYRLTIFKVKETDTPLWGKTSQPPEAVRSFSATTSQQQAQAKIQALFSLSS